jgi:hypothetical protein
LEILPDENSNASDHQSHPAIQGCAKLFVHGEDGPTLERNRSQRNVFIQQPSSLSLP